MIVPPPTPGTQHAANPATLLARFLPGARSTTKLISIVCELPMPNPASTVGRAAREVSARMPMMRPTPELEPPRL